MKENRDPGKMPDSRIGTGTTQDDLGELCNAIKKYLKVTHN